MKAKIRQTLARRKRRIQNRLDKNDLRGMERPMFTASNIHYEIAERTRAVSAGGIGAIHQVVKHVKLDELINQRLRLLKLCLPYHESDHVLNIAYNMLAGGTCLEHLETLRNDEVYLDAVGARRIPDPTTAGDFCRRFSPWHIHVLQETFNEARLRVWGQQPQAFFKEAVIDGDGAMVETGGECKQGIDINYKGQWGYHPLVISLANTCEPLYIVNRSGNRPSHEGAAFYYDQAVNLCRKAGFQKILLRGDTDFSQTKHLDGWDAGGVRFIFGMDASPTLVSLAENLPKRAWTKLERRPRYEVKTQPRRRPKNVKEQIVREREFENIRLQGEWVAEFSYQPVACERPYRMIVVRKDLEVTRGQKVLFDNRVRYFFYITNDCERIPQAVVEKANERCNQENLIAQHKSGVSALKAPVDTLESNWAYMVMASLAWSLKAWAALLLPEEGRWKERRVEEKRKLLRMEFATFQRVFMNMPAQIVRTSRRIIFRLLSWNPWQEVFFRLLDQLQQPLRC